jgi:microcystin-dependent protein
MSIYSWSLTSSSNATADAGINWQEGQNPSTVNDSARAMMSALKAGLNDIAGVSALGGSGNTFTLALSQPMASLTNAVVGFFAPRSNTGAVTLNVDTLGAKPLRFVTAVDLVSGQLISGAFYMCAYNTVNTEWIVIGVPKLSNADLPAMADQTVKGNLSGVSAVPTDVTVAAIAAAIPAATLTNTQLATRADQTMKGNLSGGIASPSNVTIAALVTALLATGSFAAIPSGSVSAFANSTVPTSWLECNGAAVSRTTYAALFTALGTTYGVGDGTTTFNVPDLRGEFIRGWDHSKGTDSGRAIASLQTDDLKAHTHTLSMQTGTIQYSNGGTGFPALNGSSTTGSTGGTETRPRNIAMMYCIKT